jgi:hypothetical protein
VAGLSAGKATACLIGDELGEDNAPISNVLAAHPPVKNGRQRDLAPAQNRAFGIHWA